MQNKCLTGVLLFLLTSLVSWAQDYNFQHITTVDGLSHNEVRKIVKDSKGFLWFGTQNGLDRFDGYRFKVYKHSLRDSTTIAGDKIFSLIPSIDKLWVGTVTGLSVINIKALEVIPTPRLSGRLDGKVILHLFFDGIDKVWLSTEDENFSIDTETFDFAPVLPNYNIACMTKGFGSLYWIGTDKGLLLFDPKNAAIVKSYDIGSFNGYGLDEIYTNSYGEVWITLGNNVFRYQSERDRFIQVYTSKSVNSIAEDKDGSLFFGSYGDGLIRYKRSSGLFETFSANPKNHFSLSSNDVYEVYVDNENILWVGTQEGLDYYDFSRQKFNSLVHLPQNGNSLGSSFVQTLFRDKGGTFWVGTREGIDLVDFDENYKNPKITHFETQKQGFKALNESYISCIYEDSKNRIWIASMDNGLFLYQKQRKILERFEPNGDNTGVASNSVRSIMEDHLGRLWFGTSGGLSLMHEDDGGNYTFENLGYPEYHTDSSPFNDIYSIFQDSKKRIWIGTNKGGLGLLQEQGSGKSFLRFTHIPDDPKSLSNDEVFVIYEDTKHQVWFGTSGGGLNLLKEDGASINNQGYYFESYTETDGLSDNEINSILEDGSDNLWIATNKGLSKFNPKEESFSNYTTYDGVLKGKFRKNARWKTEDGILFFGGAAGINFFDPDLFKVDKTKNRPVFTHFSIDGNEIKMGEELDGTEVLIQPLDSGSVITLPAKDNRFQIEFSSLSFTSPLRNEYAYKLEGIDENWRTITGKNPRATYSKLPPGSYRFYVKNSHKNDILNEQPVYLDIQVKSAFFEGKLLKIGIAVLLFTTLILAVLVFRKLKKSAKIKRHGQNTRISSKTIDSKMHQENREEIAILEKLMQTDKLYLDAELGLGQLAKKMDVSPNHLSMLLNDCVGKNFYDYINYFRVEEVKKSLKDPAYSKQTLSSIGGDCGFNSKSAFNRIFKNLTGKTPSQYQKQTTLSNGTHP